MKTGRCPRCRRRMVLVRTIRCGCGLGHRSIAQHGGCLSPICTYIVRTHVCGRRIKPNDIRELEETRTA